MLPSLRGQDGLPGAINKDKLVISAEGELNKAVVDVQKDEAQELVTLQRLHSLSRNYSQHLNNAYREIIHCVEELQHGREYGQVREAAERDLDNAIRVEVEILRLVDNLTAITLKERRDVR